MALHTPTAPLDRFSGSPVRNGLAVGGLLTVALLVISRSVETTVAGATYLFAVGLICAYAVDTALHWGRWLAEVTADRPDTPVERLRRGRRDAAPDDEDETTDPVERAHERYVRGDVDEAQFEAELETALVEAERDERLTERAAERGERET